MAPTVATAGTGFTYLGGNRAPPRRPSASVHPPIEEDTMSDLTEIVDTYLAGLNETDDDQRRQLIERAWSTDCLYIDPGHEARGRRAIGALAAGVQEQLPGHRFRRTSAVDAHHDQARFAWELVAADGAVAVAGLDVAEVHGDGRLRRVTGFFGELPADAASG
jgi:hypothetical protein